MDGRKGIGVQGNKVKNPILKSLGASIRLTERDFDVLRFSLEMKFSSLEVLYARFFKFDGARGTLWYTRERISVLVQSGYLSPVRVHFEAKRFYLATRKAVQALRSRFPEVSFPPALDTIDVRSFEHDKRVMECRVLLENSGRAREWRSERILKHLQTRRELSIARRDSIPDGIYLNRRSELVAFEFELSQKTKDRYAKKVNEYAILMAQAGAPFRRTLFVVSTDFQFTTFKELTAPYGDQFRIVSYAEILGGKNEQQPIP